MSADGDDEGLLAELRRGGRSGIIDVPGLIRAEIEPGDVLSLARQGLPYAEAVTAPSIRVWARELYLRLLSLPDGAPWRVHIWPHFGVTPPGPSRGGARAFHTERLRKSANGKETSRVPPAPRGPPIVADAGVHRCQLIRAALGELLKERRRSLRRSWSDQESPWTEADALLQLVLTAPDRGWISMVAAPELARWRQLVWPFEGGLVPVEPNPEPPSRAFAKLVEAERRMGRPVLPGERGVDLGASPGGWSWVALQRGASVIAVDRSPLRDDLMAHPRLQFEKGDAFRWRPPAPVDWLWCDVIAAPERSIELVLSWLREGLCRYFVVSIKLRGPADHPQLDRLKAELPALADPWYLTQLCANKGEVCVFGERKRLGPPGPEPAP